MRLLSIAAILLALAPGACSTSSGSPTPSSEAIARPASNGLEKVDAPELVCMVNDQYMGRPQIPVAVGGKTYFGCCEACKSRLTTDPATRIARDPVTKQPVDKATAVIARDQRGSILYFSSEQTLALYRPER